MNKSGEVKEYIKAVKDKLSGKQRQRIKCPICGWEIREPFGHFTSQHTKGDLALLICKLLKVRPF